MILWAISISLLIILFIRRYYVNKNYPPGPVGIPLLGVLPTLLNYTHKPLFLYFRILGEKYGDVFSFYIGVQKFVVLNSYDVIREALIDHSSKFSYRPLQTFFKYLSDGFSGVVYVDGPKWKEHRRFMLRVLHQFGMGKHSMEDAILFEAQYIETLVASSLGKAVDMKGIFVKGVSNIITKMVFGERWGYTDKSFLEYVSQIENVTQAKLANYLPVYYPILCHDFIMHKIPIISNIKAFRQTVQTKLDIVKMTYQDFDKEPSNLIECYLQERHRLEMDKSSDEHTFDDRQIGGIVTDLVFAATDTSTVSLSWGLLLLAIHPDVQTKVHQELDSVLGKDKPPFQMSSRLSLHYVQACLDEVSRWATIGSLGIEKRVIEDIVVHGYQILKSDIVYANIYAVHHDSRLWTNPYDFQPERFLNSDGHYCKNDHMISFSVGKRICPGESLARMEFFLIFTYLMQRYWVDLDPESSTKLDWVLEGTSGIVHSPRDHKLIFKKR